MELNKEKNIKRNVLFGVVNKLIMMVCPFIVRTIIIWKLGMEYVGLGSLFTSILQVMSLAELGVGNAIIYSMYKPIAENNIGLICALLSCYRKIYKIIGIIVLGLGLAIIPIIPKLISGSYPDDINIFYLYLIYLFNNVLSYFLFAYKQSLLLAHQRNDVESNIGSLANVLMYSAQIIALLVTKNYYAYIIFIPACTFLINILRNKKVKKMFPEYMCQGSIPTDIKTDMKKRVVGLMLTRLCQVCRNSFDSIVISAILGLLVLGQYQNYYYIMNTIIGFLTIITTSIVAGIGNDIVTKTVEENYRIFNIFLFGYNWISNWCTVCLLCLYQPFMKIWVGEKNMFSIVLVILMCVYFYSLKVGDVVSVYKEATGIYWEDRARPIVESIANLVLNFMLVRLVGVYGVVISTIISIVFINIPWSAKVLFSSYFKKDFGDYLMELLKNYASLIVICISTFFICMLINVNNNWLELVIKALICILIPNFLFIALNIKNKNLYLFMSHLKRIK